MPHLRSPPPLGAMKSLYRRHYGFVWQAVRRFGVQPLHIDDAVQDTFVTAYRRFDELELPTARGWLYGIARRVASNYRRAAARSNRKRDALAVLPADRITPDGSELVISVERFLAALTPVERELFVLSELEGMSGPELATALSLNMSTAYSRLQVLRRRFRASVGEPPAAVAPRLRRERPAATLSGWGLLLPHLGSNTAPTILGSLGLGSVWHAAAVALPAALVAFLGIRTLAGSPEGPAAHSPLTSTAASGQPRADGVDAPSADAPMATANPSPAVLTTPMPTSVSREATTRPFSDVIATWVGHEVAARSPRASDDHGRAGDSRSIPSPSLARHNQLLVEATAAVRSGRVEVALATLATHAREFPASPLDDVRGALRIEAMCAAGRTTQARGEARLWRRKHPRSPVVTRIEQSCAAGSVESPTAGQQP